MGLFTRRSRTGFTVIKPLSQEALAEDLARFLADELGKRAVSITRNKEGDISSISVPTTALRRKITDPVDTDLANALKNSLSTIQDVDPRTAEVSELLQAPVYVSEAKTVGASYKRRPTTATAINNIERLKSTLQDWGQIKIPAVILLLMSAGVLYGAYRLGQCITKLANDYASLLSDAQASEAGLERAIRQKSGVEMAKEDMVFPATAPGMPTDESFSLDKSGQKGHPESHGPAPSYKSVHPGS